MASRILYEEDIAEQILDKTTAVFTKHVQIKQESSTNECSSIQESNLDNNKQNESINNENTQTTEKIDLKITNQRLNTNTCDDTDQDDYNTGNISNHSQKNTTNNSLNDTIQDSNSKDEYDTADKCNNVLIEKNSNVCPSTDGAKVKAKKKPSELELLGVDIKKIEEWESEYDVYGDDSKIFRKYKLRKTERQVYKEPPNFPLKRRFSSDESSEEPSSLICPVCEDIFDTKRALKIHVRYHNEPIKEFTCSICSQKFKKNADLIAHKSIHSSESFVCKRCKVAFSDHRDFLVHNIIHTYGPQIKCLECGLNYKRSSYRTHIMTHYERKFSCHLCSFVTNANYYLGVHMNTVHNSKYECVECGRRLKDKKMFELHMSTHTGVKKYQCLYCGKCFGTKNMRTVHTRLHTGEKPFACDICGYRAAQSTDVKRHKITHEKEKKFSCEVCAKKFLRQESLLIHMTSHTKKNLYKCPVCGHQVTTVSGLKVHMLSKHTQERPVECTFCNKKFVDNSSYRKHAKLKIHKRRAYGHMMQEKS